MNPNTSTPSVRNRPGLVAGAILILVGIVMFAAQFLGTAGWLFFGALALVFLVAGLLTRQNGLVIPGGILSGLALGIYLVEGPLQAMSEPHQGGYFMLALGAGWVLVTLASLLIHALDRSRARMLWPLIPAAGLAVFGGLLATDNLRLLELMGQGWPLVLIVIGLYLVLRRREMQD